MAGILQRFREFRISVPSSSDYSKYSAIVEVRSNDAFMMNAPTTSGQVETTCKRKHQNDKEQDASESGEDDDKSFEVEEVYGDDEDDDDEDDDKDDDEVYCPECN